MDFLGLSPTSTTASSLTRPRIAVVAFSAVATLSIGYYTYIQLYPESQSSLSGLHRSNAVRRGHRRARRTSTASDQAPADENTEFEPQAPIHDDDPDDWWTDNHAAGHPRAGHNIVNLLFRVSEDNARRNASVHRGCACNSCGMVPIRGVRYRCANCADFDLCETCESQGMHPKTHIFYKIKIPAPPFGPRQMQPVWYAGNPDNYQPTLPKDLISKLTKGTGFERPEIEAYWEQFTFMANTEWNEDPDGLCLAMDRKTFERCLVPSGGSRHATPNLIHDRMLAFYDTDKNGLIGFAEFLEGLAYRKRKDKLQRIFQGYDIDGDGYVNRRDFLRMFRAYYVLYKQMHRDILDGLDDQLMGNTDARQLVRGRQPLSSHFARESSIPPARERSQQYQRKTLYPNGEIELESPDTRPVTEDTTDTSTRRNVLERLWASPDASVAYRSNDWTGPTSPPSDLDTTYLDALLQPPTTLEEIPGLLNGTRSEENDVEEHEISGAHADGDSDSIDSAEELTSPEDENAPPSVLLPRTTQAPPQTVDPSHYTNRPPTESQIRARMNAQRRQMQPRMERRRQRLARSALHYRWRRRGFYLDEEEGGTEPDGWVPEDDDPLPTAAIGSDDAATLTQGAPSRSRSSSKVRFLEDMEAQLDPSGVTGDNAGDRDAFDVPEEERDAGKEVLYQVTQQAFNELLDVLFFKAEEWAIEAAESKDLRDKHRPLFENIRVAWKDSMPVEEQADPLSLDADVVQGLEADEKTDAFIEQRTAQDPALDELLRSSGYTVDPTLAAPTTGGEGGDPETQPAGEAAVEEINEEAETPPDDLDEEEENPRDPTMPQFRPNSDQDHIATTPPMSSLAHDTRKSSPRKRRKPKSKEATVPRDQLVRWKAIDELEEKAKDRGGWGKLNFKEFEDIYIETLNDGMSHRLEYIGSWIDFCIP